jgi:endonuclease V-like protein UPF0215 family
MRKFVKKTKYYDMCDIVYYYVIDQQTQKPVISYTFTEPQANEIVTLLNNYEKKLEAIRKTYLQIDPSNK